MTYLGLDCGASALKATLVDKDERVLATAVEAYRPAHPRLLWSDQNPDDWLAAEMAGMVAKYESSPASRGRKGATPADDLSRPRLRHLGLEGDAGR